MRLLAKIIFYPWKRNKAMFLVLVGVTLLFLIPLTLRYLPEPPPPPQTPPPPAIRPPAYDGVQEIVVPKAASKVIGYACAGNCGSWADQQTGIVNAYVMSAILEKRFKIDLRRPCDLEFLLSPKDLTVDWRLNPGELDGKEVNRVQRLGNDGVAFAEEFLALPDPNVMFQGDYIFLTTNVDVVRILRNHTLAQIVPWLRQKTVPEIYHKVLTDLFSLNPSPRAELDNLIASLPDHSKLVCAHIHVGDSMERAGHLSGLFRFLTFFNQSLSSSSPSHFLFTSDNPQALERAQNYFPSQVVEKARHVIDAASATGNDVCGNFAHSIVEQMVLSKCDVLVVSGGGVAKIAALLRNTDQHLYLFRQGVVERVSRESLLLSSEAL